MLNYRDRETVEDRLATTQQMRTLKRECEAAGVPFMAMEIERDTWVVKVDVSKVEAMHVQTYNARLKGA